jgi:hypothetical protein
MDDPSGFLKVSDCQRSERLQLRLSGPRGTVRLDRINKLRPPRRVSVL